MCYITEEAKQHALDEHSNAEKEWREWRQLPLKKEDLEYIETVINDYGFIDTRGDIRFWRHTNNHWYICCCQIKEGNILEFKTMYIKP